MQSNSIFTRKNMGLDNNIWISLLSCVILSFGLLGYRLIKKDRVDPCAVSINIYADGRLETEKIFFEAGRLIPFKVSPSTAEDIVWNFGDNSDKEEGNAVIHHFDREGMFTVTATVNNKCDFTKRINIKNKEVEIVDSGGKIVENIVGNDRPLVGEKIKYTTTLPASSYEWFLQNINAAPKTGQEASFQFTKQQSYTLVLRLDHDNKKRFTKTINVTDPFNRQTSTDGPIKKLVFPDLPQVRDSAVNLKPDSPKVHIEPVKKKFTALNDVILKEYLQSVVCKGMKADQFDDFLCDGINTTVIVNNKDRITFAQLCNDIQGKKIKIESATGGNPENNCIKVIKVSYDKKGFIGSLFGKGPCK